MVTLRRAGLSVIFLMFMTGIALANAGKADGPLFLTMNQNSILRLQQDAMNVIVNNPGHVSVALADPRLLILTPHATGATSMIVLGSGGQVIFQRDIIVSNVQRNYVRVRRVCNGNSACDAVTYSYCPNGCYDVTPISASGNGGPATAAPPAAEQGGGEAEVQAAPPGTIDGEPANTLIDASVPCPPGYNKVYVPGVMTGDQRYTCTQ